MFQKLLPLLVLTAGIIYGLISNTPVAINRDESSLADPSTLLHLTLGNIANTPGDDRFANFHGTLATPPPPGRVDEHTEILGTTTASDKRIEVDLTNQRVYAYEGTNRVYEFIVSTGKWGWTPTGEFTIWTKVRSQLMKGGSKELGTYYYLPNVPYVMFFSNDKIAKMRGFSFHGTYWHNNFGHPMSHGCINMKNADAKTLYEWATPLVTNAKAWSTPATLENPGTRVSIYGTTPRQ